MLSSYPTRWSCSITVVSCAMRMPATRRWSASIHRVARFVRFPRIYLIHSVWPLRTINSTGLTGQRKFYQHQNEFYFIEHILDSKKLESVDREGIRQKPIQTSFFGSHKMYAMTAVEQNCPQYQSLCQINNGGCTDSRICLVNRKAPSGKSCKCTSASTSCTLPSPFTPLQPGQ